MTHLKFFRTGIIILVITLLSSTNSFAQDEHDEHSSFESIGMHRVFAGLGHAYITDSKADGNSAAVASWAVGYSYRISERWGAGLQSEILLESFIIIEDDGGELEREYPINIAPVAIYQVWGHLSAFGGFGFEIAPEETIRFTRLGAEYGVELNNNWELAFSAIWDWKIGVYNSFGVSILIGKMWGGNHKNNTH